MSSMLLGNRYRARIVAEEVEIPRTFWARARLWMGRREPPPGRALLFPSAAVHTFFMRFPVDAAFLDERWKVLEVVRGLKPFRGAGPVKGASRVLLLPAGGLPPEVLSPGDELEWVPRTSERVSRGARPEPGSTPPG